jgi:hypothetical protein
VLQHKRLRYREPYISVAGHEYSFSQNNLEMTHHVVYHDNVRSPVLLGNRSRNKICLYLLVINPDLRC